MSSRIDNDVLSLAGVDVEVVKPEDGYHDWKAFVPVHPGIYGAGGTRDAAIGDLMRTWGSDLWEKKAEG